MKENELEGFDAVQDKKITALEDRNSDLQARLVAMETTFALIETKVGAIAGADWAGLEDKIIKAELHYTQQ